MSTATGANRGTRIEQLLSAYPGAVAGLPTKLLDHAQTVQLNEGQFAFRRGENCSAYLVLLKGTVRVQLLSDEGREITLYRVEPGNSCVLTTSCLLSHEDYPAEAVVEKELAALAVSSTAFRKALETEPAFRTFVFHGFSQRLTNVISRIAELAFTSIDARLARELIRLEKAGRSNVTHQELGVELGTAREVVSRHLKRFEQRGWVRLGRGRLIVTDLERLRRIGGSALSD